MRYLLILLFIFITGCTTIAPKNYVIKPLYHNRTVTVESTQDIVQYVDGAYITLEWDVWQ